MLAAKRSLGNLRSAARLHRNPSLPQLHHQQLHIHHSAPLPASAGSSLSSSSSSAAAAAASTSPIQASAQLYAHSRGLASAVLLSSSRKTYEGKTVKELQQVLGERGLSTRGKKAVLVDRLVSSDSSAHIPRAATVSSPSSPFSTSSNASASSSTPSPSSKEGRNDVNTEDVASPEDPLVVSENVKVFTPSPVQPGSEPPTANDSKNESKVTAAPGMVVDKAVEEKVAHEAEEAPGGGIDMPSVDAVFLPDMKEQERNINAELMIPSPPDQYKSPADYDYDVNTQPFTMHPSWIKVEDSDAEVVHHGTPHKPTDDPDTRSSEPRKEFEYASDRTALQEMLSDIGIRYKPKQAQKKAKEVKEEAEEQASRLMQTLSSLAGIKIAPLSQPIKSGDGKEQQQEQQFKFQDRPLQDEERTGLYVLAGLFAGGFFLGGLGKRSKTASGEEHDGSAKAAPASKGH